MIDRTAFATVMGGFADRIGRALSPATFDMYLDVLSEALTTEEFLTGARIVFRTHHWNTWPAPQQFIDAANPPAVAKVSAGELFEKVLAITNDPRIPPNETWTRVALLGPVVERAYRAAGGLREFRNVLEADVKWLRKSFVETYELAATDATKHAEAALALIAVDAKVRGLAEGASRMMEFPRTLSGEGPKRLPDRADGAS